MSDLPQGTKIDRYIIQERLGSGGFSTVYRASHFMIGHSVALKLLLPEHTNSPVIVERLFREARASASIGNPHIVKVLDCGTSPQGQMFIAMELLEGRVLTEVIAREAPLPVERSVGIILQVLDGLAAAHAADIIHRDIKPENIFLLVDKESGGDFVKVLDFGISKVLEESAAGLTREGEVLGTPTYMAPEQIHGAAAVDHRADLYSVAAVLYNMLSGRRPLAAATLGELARKLLMEDPPPLSSVASHVPEELSSVVMRGLEKEPDRRWLDALSFASALRSCLPDLPLEAPSPPREASGPGLVAPAASPDRPGTLPTSGWTAAPTPTPTPSGPVVPMEPLAVTHTPPRRKVPLWLVLVLVAVTVLFMSVAALAIAFAVGAFSGSSSSGGGTSQGTSSQGQGSTYTGGQGQGTGQPANSLRRGLPVTGVLPMGQRLDYPLHVDQRGVVNIAATSTDFDTFLYLLVNGAEVGRDDDGAGGLNSRISLFLEPGDYVVRVGSFQDAGGGRFTLTVY